MKNKNKFSKLYFILFSVFLSVLFNIWYDELCFCRIDGFTTEASYNIFIALSIFLPALGILINLKNRRNYLSVFTNAIIAPEIYSILVLSADMPIFYKIVFYITVSVAAIYFVLVLVQKTKAKNKKQVFLKKMRVSLLGMRTIAAICFLVILLPFCTMQALDLGIVRTSGGVDSPETKVWTAKENADTLSKLEENQWNELNTDEKLEVLNVVKNIELSDLGVKRDVALIFDDNGEYNHGFYQDESHTISINIDKIRNDHPAEILDTLLHECRHVYQHECAELYDSVDPKYKDIILLKTAADYKNSLDNYISAVEDFEAYENQLAEADAREYSSKKLAVYYKYFGRSNKNEKSQ